MALPVKRTIFPRNVPALIRPGENQLQKAAVLRFIATHISGIVIRHVYAADIPVREFMILAGFDKPPRRTAYDTA